MSDEAGIFLVASATALTRDLPRQTLREVISGKIAALIAARLLEVGDELPSERALAAALSVSRETVRGAIQTLAARGILDVSHGTRTRVAKADIGDMAVALPGRLSVNDYALDDVHSARVAVEREVASLAAEHITEDLIDLLARSIAAQQDCEDDPVRFLICDREFHATIYRACGNALLADLALDLFTYLVDHRRRIVSRPGRIAESIADHRAILDALCAHDRDAAIAAFGRHEDRIYTTTRDLLAETGGTEG